MKELEDTIRSVIRQAVISGKHATTADESVRIQDQMCDYAVERILNASKKAFQTQ
ncbi:MULTISPECIES: hypothetical protein [Acetobacter]|uniref:hypothetical protein n=1 Tax=Acetobacter TaxID=434 RepID=UPI00030A5B39|nr:MULTISPECIES: hypothetical protein [Acetobacter]KGB22902.1 hypothetical protein ApDm4_2216 [Acetobacter pomorum]